MTTIKSRTLTDLTETVIPIEVPRSGQLPRLQIPTDTRDRVPYRVASDSPPFTRPGHVPSTRGEDVTSCAPKEVVEAAGATPGVPSTPDVPRDVIAPHEVVAPVAVTYQGDAADGSPEVTAAATPAVA